MTVSKEYNKHIYEGNGVTRGWPYDFDLPITAAGTPDTSLIHVFRTNLRGEVSEVTAFSIDAETGTLTYPTSGSPLEDGEKLTILRLLDVRQQFFDPSNQANLYPETLEDNTDRLVMMVQQLQEETGRAVKVSVSTDPDEEDTTAEGIFEARDIAQAAAETAEGYAAQLPAIADELGVNLVTDEADLRAQIAAIGASNATLVIATPIPIAEDLTISSNVALSFKKTGQLQPASDKTLTINGPIDAGLWQIFGGEGALLGDPQNNIIYPEWFGNDLSATATFAGSNKKTIEISGEVSADIDTTIPTTVTLRFLTGGEVVTAPSKTLTINGPIEAGKQLLFSGDGTVTRSSTSGLTVYPEWFGAIGNGATNDDGIAIRKATTFLDTAKGSRIIFTGTYMIRGHELDQRVSPPSYCTLDFQPGAVLQVVPNSSAVYTVIHIIATVHDVCIHGATIIGDRSTHTYAVGDDEHDPGHEWGHGIYIESTVGNITISNCTVKDCTGDGLCLNATLATTPQNSYFTDSLFYNNRRQGCSITAWNGGVFRNCEFSGTNGTPPQCGVDIEPNNATDPINNLFFYGCRFFDNANTGFTIYSNNTLNEDMTVYIEEGFMKGNAVRPIWTYVMGSAEGKHALVIVKNCIAIDHPNDSLLEDPAGGGLVHYFFEIYEKTATNLGFEEAIIVQKGGAW